MSTNTAEVVAPAESDKITCQICGDLHHAMQIHLRDNHPEVSLAEYQERFPEAPIFSEAALAKIKQSEEAKRVKVEHSQGATALHVVGSAPSKAELASTFGLRNSPRVKRPNGDPIMISMGHHCENGGIVPEIDNNYVWNVDDLKIALMAMEMNIPAFFWGHAGVGKSTVWEQVSARTNRPFIRVQHTGSTEESHILGQMAANKDGTYFEPGPLPLAMKYGWTYLADEYDFAFPHVMGVYQPVLEGKPLYIKEASPEWRLVKPHPNFRIIATGNTNGAGDETGLYQGTNVQNAANFERFGIVHKVDYMDAREEQKIVIQQSGLTRDHAKTLVEFAGLVRKAYEKREITNTLGPRVLINIGKLWIARGSAIDGVKLAFANRLPETDAKVVSDLAQRKFG